MTTRRTRLVELLVGVAALATFATSVSVAAVRVTRDDPLTAEDWLARARAFAVEHDTVRFRTESRTESTFGGGGSGGEDVPEDESTTFINRAVDEGASAGNERFRSITRSDGVQVETITVGDHAWKRFAEPGDDLDDMLWSELRLDAFEDGPGGGFGGEVSTDLRWLGNIVELIDRAAGPTIESSTGGKTVVRAGILPDANTDTDFVTFERGSVEVTVADDGRPLRSVVEVTMLLGGDGSFGDAAGSARAVARIDQEYSDWGEPVDIEPPPADEIDLTPGVEEEAIAEFADAPLYQPRGIPEGWVLDYADLLPSFEGDTGCDQVELDYIDPEDEEYGYLYLYEMAPDCADLAAPSDSEPFTAGPNRGWVESEDGYTYAQIVVGRTVIEADTDLSPDALAQVLGQLRTLDFDVEPEPITGLAPAGGTRS